MIVGGDSFMVGGDTSPPGSPPMDLSGYKCLYVDVMVCVCVLSVCDLVCVRACKCACVFECVHACVCVHACMCVHAYVCVHTCVCVCEREREREREKQRGWISMITGQSSRCRAM